MDFFFFLLNRDYSSRKRYITAIVVVVVTVVAGRIAISAYLTYCPSSVVPVLSIQTLLQQASWNCSHEVLDPANRVDNIMIEFAATILRPDHDNGAAGGGIGFGSTKD